MNSKIIIQDNINSANKIDIYKPWNIVVSKDKRVAVMVTEPVSSNVNIFSGVKIKGDLLNYEARYNWIKDEFPFIADLIINIR